jgi:hypothetical protein
VLLQVLEGELGYFGASIAVELEALQLALDGYSRRGILAGAREQQRHVRGGVQHAVRGQIKDEVSRREL